MSSAPDNHDDARYPPIMKRFPSTQISAMMMMNSNNPVVEKSSSSSVGGGGGSGGLVWRSSGGGVTPHAVSDATMMDSRRFITTTANGALAAGSTSTSMASPKPLSARPSQHLARVKFCQWNMVGCINCIEPSPENFESTGCSYGPEEMATVLGSNASAAPRKQGPLLLDLRRLTLNESSLSVQQDDKQDEASPLFTMTSICQSRGNPSLGTSVASTCLDFDNVLSKRNQAPYIPPCATGLTTGALCIHTFAIDGDTSDDPYYKLAPSIDYFHMPRHHRPATAVSWRLHNPSHVAIGYGGTSHVSTGGGGGSSDVGFSNHGAGTVSTTITSTSPTAIAATYDRSRRLANTNAVVGGGTGNAMGATSNAGDRDYCCFIWDIEHQPSQGATTTAASSRSRSRAPLYKLSHTFGVASLAWILDSGQTLIVGGQQRNLQLYDMRSSSSNQASALSPTTVFGHTMGVHGIEVDPTRSSIFASYSRSAGEPVKLWDARNMEAPFTEIKVGGGGATATYDSGPTQSPSVRSPSVGAVTSVKWSTLSPGSLSILVGDSLHQYNTVASTSRPTHVQTTRMRQPVLDFAHYPFTMDAMNETPGNLTFAELLPKRIVAVDDNQSTHVIAAHRIAPLLVSPRTGQVIHALGRTLFTDLTFSGAMEDPDSGMDEDISATMRRRARCLHAAKYSMEATSNITLLASELSLEAQRPQPSLQKTITEEQFRLWKWIRRVEALRNESMDDTLDVVSNWPAKSILDAGACKLLELDESSAEQQRYSDTLSCKTYDSRGRRAALLSCGWAGMFDLGNVMAEFEEKGEFERSAALAVWYGDISAAVDALDRAVVVHTNRNKLYNEVLELVAVSIAGYRGDGSHTSVSGIWRKTCKKVLQRTHLSNPTAMPRGANYLRHILKFLMDIGIDSTYKEVMEDSSMSLCDRVAFGCRFLADTNLHNFLDQCIAQCLSSGSIEGIAITGMGKQGIEILQSYVDRSSDVQTATLVTSRVIFPVDWIAERKISAEWLNAYRSLLNRWQMWQSRAMFDVDRADLLRGVKLRLSNDAYNNANGPTSSRRAVSIGRRPGAVRSLDPDIHAAIPAQLDARCNYCSTSLVLRRTQEGQPNQWLSKMKSILQCCPKCRKPLPRCAICMLSLGALNPYMELTKERPRISPRDQYLLANSTGPSHTLTSPDDLSSLANLPFAEWFSWCLRCKHGGHAHHMVGWFAKHEICPVSGCNCRCQFDGINKLQLTSVSSSVSPDSPQK